jgi:predicted aminopeptidase
MTMMPGSCGLAARAAARRVVLPLAATLVLVGCSAVEYYWQGIAGQLDLMSRSKPIPEVAESTPDPALRDRLRQVQRIRAYASRELALPDNGSYTRYADLGRPFVVWNVFATPELSLNPRQWCFPVAGCVAYRGYFAEADARTEAARLAAENLDVHVSGVPAYSTLGYFDDPVLSTFIRYREAEVARLIFHELAHQVVYVKDDSAFNESFAVAVEEEGLARWLVGQAERTDAVQFAADVARAQRLRAEFRSLVRSTRGRLDALYASDATEADKRAGKAMAFAEMRIEYERMKAGWDGAPGFDRWFTAGANNAGIAAAGLYADRVPQFAALLRAEGGDLPRFYGRVKELAGLPKPERDASLAATGPTPASPADGTPERDDGGRVH